MLRQLAPFVYAATLVATSVIGALIGALWGFGLKCDDSCATPPTSWRDDPDAWQWNALAIVALVAVCVAVLFLAALARRWLLLAVTSLLAWAALAASFIVLFDESGLTSNPERGWIGLAILGTAGVVAVALVATAAGRAKTR
jgi:hypothetical protein